MTRKSFGSRGFSGRVLVSCRQRTSKSQASLSRTAPRLLALARFQEQIVKCFLDRRSAFFMMGLKPPPPDFIYHLSFPFFFVCACVRACVRACVYIMRISIDVSNTVRDPRCMARSCVLVQIHYMSAQH